MIFVWIKALFKGIGSAIGAVLTAADGLTRNEWFMVMAVVCGAGIMCMRGFGSRKSV